VQFSNRNVPNNPKFCPEKAKTGKYLASSTSLVSWDAAQKKDTERCTFLYYFLCHLAGIGSSLKILQGFSTRKETLLSPYMYFY